MVTCNHHLFNVLELVEDLTGAFQVHLARLGQREAARGAVEQAGAQTPFQVSNMTCRHCIRDIHRAGRAGAVGGIGAGTGAITKHIESLNPLLVEIDREFCALLQQNYPHLNIVNSCALEQLKKVTERTGLVVSIPLINNPFKTSFIPLLNHLYSNGLVSWCVIFTYGLKDPLEEVDFKRKARKHFVLQNFPPAHVWVYS